MRYSKRLVNSTAKSSAGNYIQTLKEKLKSKSAHKQSTLNSSFKAMTREGRDSLFAGHSKKPSIGQYNPNYATVTRRCYSPYVRKKELGLTLDGHFFVPQSCSPKAQVKLCRKIE